MMQFTLLTLVLGFSSVLGQDEVTIDLGKIRGKSFTTRNGKSVSGYLGIPYATPPTGPLRFKSPERNTEKFEDVFMADTDANMCPQMDDNGKVVGDEDCLYLNVYTPTESSGTPLATMVYFHGGDFVKGSASSVEVGPEYLMDRDIVLVTVNYRLGALGFLSTGNSVAPGNYGLKDQGLALQWVRDNIASFNGDPSQVTLFGHGAGGVSTSFHAIYNTTKGLFQRYISASGNGNCMWGFEETRRASEHSKDLATVVDCPTSDSQALVDCLRNIDLQRLVDSDSIFKTDIFKMRTWVPTAESGADAFIDLDPVRKVLFSDIDQISCIVGNVKDEGLHFTAELYKNQSLYDKMHNDKTTYVKYLVDMLTDRDTNEYLVDKVENFYFKDTPGSSKEDFIKAMTSLITDEAFGYPAIQQMSLIADEWRGSANFYSYEFDYRGSTSLTSDTIGTNEDIGVTNDDDLQYFFPMKKSGDPQLSDSDEKMSDLMIDLWTSFAITGKPTSQALPNPNVWEDFIKSQRFSLKIGENSDPTAANMYDPLGASIDLWSTLTNNKYVG